MKLLQYKTDLVNVKDAINIWVNKSETMRDEKGNKIETVKLSFLFPKGFNEDHGFSVKTAIAWDKRLSVINYIRDFLLNVTPDQKLLNIKDEDFK